MMRITALNDEAQNDESEDEIQVTKEAEETIAVSEYMRALTLKAKGKNENALILLQELLETRVLHEVSSDKTDTLFGVKYNCHKNIALIYEEKENYDSALEHYLHAMHLDDSEVYTMNRLGQLALKLKHWELARHAFQKCLTRNPNHWPAADGILQVLCSTENILGAYGWAMKWHNKDKNYKRALDVLFEITEKFENLIPFFESVYKCSFKPSKALTENFKPQKESVFPVYDISIEDVKERTVKPDLHEFQQESLNWLTVGKFIVSVYNYCNENKYSIIFLLTIEDIAQKKCEQEDNKVEETKMEVSTDNNEAETSVTTGNQEAENTTENEIFIAPIIENGGFQMPTQQSDSNTEDSDNQKSESEPAKPKPRRRCSDLSFLEQWGWHKNRRYSSRKKSQQDKVEIDTTLNGFLKRIFSKYFEENFDNELPFLADSKKEDNENEKKDIKSIFEDNQISYDEFQKKTENDFQQFLKELQSQNFDLILLLFLWLKYISKYWDQPITEELKKLYHSIYEFYLNHYDLVTWNQLSNDDFNASYRMTLFFMELDYEKMLHESRGQSKNEMDSKWKMLYHHLKFNSGCAYVISDEIYDKNIIRLMWLDYLSAKCENDLNRSVECLIFLESLIDKQEKDFNLFLPNLNQNNTINLELIKSVRINLQRKISLNNVRNLYENKKYDDLIEILKDSLVNCTEIKNSDNTVMKIQTQFEVLLESFWNLGKYEECLIWSERCLKHAVDNLLAAPSDTYRYKEWAESVNFILIYIEELILLESYEILTCLEKYLSRLVQSLSKILVHQLDTPFDKNNNPVHPVNPKRPWVILHQVLQRVEDHCPVIIKKKSLETATEIEDIEEVLPHTILVLFTAHEFLGRRQWCTRDNGQLLLYTLNNVASKFRAPFMDSYRDLVAEYLEQITYCLYGYPPKKARSRHIEEHDATPVELTWTRAIQLFDLYRPENLPEFNSYKLDSISADMEQLLLKILPLIPKDSDPSSTTINIRDFISGKTEELPQECGLLPHRIRCLYYLLADYYFKNRDFSKTIKYYILDLTCEPTRFDSWAGLALSKASRLETKLNSCIAIDVNEFLFQTEEAQRCFEQCIKLNKNHTLLWIEYGSFAYIVHSFCSRNLKNSTDTLSMEKFAFVEAHKERYLNISYNCFTYVDKNIKTHNEDVINEDNESHDEKWLHHYMLGKIAEKRKEHPKVFLDHYLTAANFLYESNATYPIKINHNNPSTLSIEALEIFYRTTSAIIKYVEQHDTIDREIGRLFNKVLKDLASSPFAYNQAKIDDNSINALKRKLAEKADLSKNKQQKLDVSPNEEQSDTDNKQSTTDKLQSIDPAPPTTTTTATITTTTTSSSSSSTLEKLTPASTANNSKPTSPSRRGSQESTVTTVTSTTTTTGTGTESSTSSSTESDSSSSDSSSSESESEDSEDEKPDENSPLTENELEPIYRMCIRNLEECVTRFSEHYKSIYRLVNHYLNAPEKLKDLEKCKQLLLGTYTTNLGNQIIGLFSDRKNNNFFNGIWRIPSSEIDRPGGFSSHLVKCVIILLEVLRKSGEHKILIDLALQLHRTPENDKRYVKDCERKELRQQAITYSVQIMRDVLKQNMEKRNDTEILNLLIDVYKVHKKCIKHINEKETLFSQLLVDVYKFYIEDKVVKLPETTSLLDLAVRLCLQEISARKNQQKQQIMNVATSQINTLTTSSNDAIVSTAKTFNTTTPTSSYPSAKPIPIPGMPRPRGRPVGSKNASSSSHQQSQSSNFPGNLSSLLDPTSLSSFMSLYNNPALNASLVKDPGYFQKLVAEYYKLLAGPSLIGSIAPTLPNLASPSLSPILNPLSQSSSVAKSSPVSTPPITTISNMSMPSSTSLLSSKAPTVPQFDIKNLIASAASQVAKSTGASQSSSATISVGTGQLTITPTMSKSSIPTSYSAQNLSQSLQMPSKSSTSVSLIKVPTSSPTLTVKPLSELTGCKPTSSPSIPNLPDLPKSLTITPASFIASDKSKNVQSQVPQVSLFSDSGSVEATKYTGKMKSQKKTKISTEPYSKSQTSAQSFMPSLSNAVQLGNLASLAQQFPLLGNFNLQNYNQQVSLLNSYAELLKSMNTNPSVLQQLPNLGQFQMPTQKRSYTKRGRTSKTQSRYPNSMTLQQSSNSNEILSTIPVSSSVGGLSTSSNKGKSQTFLPSPFNMPLSKSPILSPSPSPVLGAVSSLAPPPPPPPSRASVTPPILSHTSPTKTLQQKLAEKQKANALHESSSKSNSGNQSNKKKDGVDVIVLD